MGSPKDTDRLRALANRIGEATSAEDSADPSARRPRCFVIQPFDNGGPFDRRYNEIIVPAIQAAGLEPYRVDNDPHAVILIESIETGIRTSAACLADISDDNPNIWFELGYALASSRPVVMICSGRDRFPFDVQSRAIVTYERESTGDFEQLSDRITTRLLAAVDSDRAARQIEGVMAPLEGLMPMEITALSIIATGNMLAGNYRDGWGMWTRTIATAMRDAGYTDAATTIAIHSLERRGYLGVSSDEHDTVTYFVNENGLDWMLANHALFALGTGTAH